MAQQHILDYDDNDMINLWADEEEIDQESNMSIISHLRSKSFESVQKTLFFRLCGLLISEMEGIITEQNFQTILKDYLLDFTSNIDLITKLSGQISFLKKEIKNIATNDNYYGNGCLKVIPEESEDFKRRIIYIDPIKSTYFTNLLQYSDFSLINRIELGLYAVMLEMGFNQFNQHIRKEIENIRLETHGDLLPVYRKGIDLVINHTIYLTNRTYGILFNKFYNYILKQFVDKI